MTDWLDEVSLGTLALAASLNLCAGLCACLDVAENLVKLQLRDLGALECVLVEGVADDVLGGPLLEPLDELVVDSLLDVDTGAGAAALAVVVENAKVDPRDCVVDVGVVEDDVGALAAEFEGDLLQV